MTRIELDAPKQGRRRAILRIVPAVVVVFLAALGPFLAPKPLEEAVSIPFGSPDGIAVLGGDHLGQDVLSHVLAGGWGLVLLAGIIAVTVTGLAALLGVVAALRPRAGAVIERVADLLILIPPVLAILLVMLSWPRSGALGLVLLAVVLGTPYSARVVAASAATVAGSGYVEAAVAGGETFGHLVWREVLPNLRTTIVTMLGLRFVEAVYVVSTAAFLQLPTGLGTTNWALMIRENGEGVLLNPAAVLAPSLAVGVLAVSVNLTVDALSPRARRLTTLVHRRSPREPLR
ncbi:ABC transporter permease subunit [Pseudonocardia sp. DLS-67]